MHKRIKTLCGSSSFVISEMDVQIKWGKQKLSDTQRLGIRQLCFV